MMGNTREPDKGPPLGRFITPDLDEARLARQRAVITARVEEQDQRKGRPRWLVIGMPTVLAAVAVVVVLLLFARGFNKADTRTATAGTVLEAPTGAPLPITLLDGSRVVLEPETKLSLMTLLAKDIRLEVNRGGIDVDVTHVEGREFVVVAAGYEVRVLGTHFAVKLSDLSDPQQSLEVQVFRGRVRVTRIGETADLRVLGAGEKWSTTLAAAAATEIGTSPSPPSPPPPRSAASSEAASDMSASPTASSHAAATTIGPRELWSQAENARASKRFQEEATALNTLRLRHRSDPRAGLAAFELGRLRQDTLHDPGGAAEAFADAIVLAPSGPFREDAEARRVEALEAAGRHDQCVEAKAAFLARYPGGIHRQRVSTRCAPR